MSADLLVAFPEVDDWFRSHGAPFSFDEVETVHASASPSAPMTNGQSSPSWGSGSGAGSVGRVADAEAQIANGNVGSADDERLSSAETASPSAASRSVKTTTAPCMHALIFSADTIASFVTFCYKQGGR